MVYIDFFIDYNSLDQLDSSTITIAGLPFSLANANFIGGNIDTVASTGLNFNTVNCHFTSNNAFGGFGFADGNGNPIRYNNAIISSSGVIQGTASYRI